MAFDLDIRNHYLVPGSGFTNIYEPLLTRLNLDVFFVAHIVLEYVCTNANSHPAYTVGPIIVA